jgi:putative MFS transporter
MVTGQIGALLVPTLGWQVMFLIGGIPGLLITVCCCGCRNRRGG